MKTICKKCKSFRLGGTFCKQLMYLCGLSYQASTYRLTRVKNMPRGVAHFLLPKVLTFSLIYVMKVHVTKLCQVVLSICKVQMEKLFHVGKFDQRLTCQLLEFTCSQCWFQIHKFMICATNSQAINHHLSNFLCIFIQIFNQAPSMLAQPLKNTPFINETFYSKFNRPKTSYLKKDFHKFSRKNMRICLWLASHI